MMSPDAESTVGTDSLFGAVVVGVVGFLLVGLVKVLVVLTTRSKAKYHSGKQERHKW
jgi:hypothetical protein